VAIGVGRNIELLEDAKESLSGAQRAVSERFRQTDQFLFWEKTYEKENTTVADIITPSLRKKLLTRIELLNGDAVGEIIRDIGHDMKNYLSNGVLIESCYHEIVELFLFGVKNYFISVELLSEDFLMRGYRSFYLFDEGIEWLAGVCCDYVKQYEQNQKNMEAKPIRMAKEYISEHYGEAISLEMVSNHIGFNPAYFSSIFKKTTNQNFMDFLTEVRIDHAKILLTQTGKDIADIANEVGYSDIKYFSIIFKKNTSLNPSEYRKLYS
jgi:two-component system response regulator YesN